MSPAPPGCNHVPPGDLRFSPGDPQEPTEGMMGKKISRSSENMIRLFSCRNIPTPEFSFSHLGFYRFAVRPALMSPLANHRLRPPPPSLLGVFCKALTGWCLLRHVPAAADPPFPAADAGGPRLLRGPQPRVHEASDQTPKALRHHQRSVRRSGHRERVEKQGPLDVSQGEAGSRCTFSQLWLGSCRTFSLF